MNLLKLPILLASLLLPSCALLDRSEPIPQVRPVEIVTIEKPAPVFHPVLPEQIVFLPVEWKILTPSDMEQYITDLKAGEAPVNVWYGLTTKGYENLSANMADIKRYLRQILNIVDYYQDLNRTEEAPEEELVE